MLVFSSQLKKEVDQALSLINQKEVDTLKKAAEVTLLLGGAFDRLRTFIRAYTFKDEAEEVLFFKQIKPNLLCSLIYYRKVYNTEINRPTGGELEQKTYLERELYRIKDYFDRNSAFYRYYRSGETCHDVHYFLRGQDDYTVCHESFSFERDPLFSTCCDFKLAKVLANEMLENYLITELAKLDEKYVKNDLVLPKIKLTWTLNKVFLVELIYALYLVGAFNHAKATLKEIVAYFECVFNVDLGANTSSTFGEMSRRKERTTFIDKLRDLLNNLMDKKEE